MCATAIATFRLPGRDLPVGVNGPTCSQCRKRMRLSTLQSDAAHPYRLPLAAFECDCGRSISMRWRPEGRRFAVMAGLHDDLRRDFAVITEPCETQRGRWRWEIKRSSKPLGVKLYDDGFSSAQSAKLAGEKALMVFLEGIVQEYCT